MYRCYFIYTLQLDNYYLLYKNVYSQACIKADTFIDNRQTFLPFISNASDLQLMAETGLIN